MVAPQTSIAMATYNGADYIKQQLQSFAEQTLLPDELIVTDDGSTDATVDIIKDFARTVPFNVRVERNHENLGYAQNFSKAISLCSGDVIFLSDQDDVWLPEKLARILHEFSVRPEIQILINDAKIVDGELNGTGLTKFQQIQALGLSSSNNNTGCCSAFRGDFRNILLPIPEFFVGHDHWLHLIADLLEVRFALPEPLQLYRRHEANASLGFRSSAKKLSSKDLFQAYSGGDSRAYAEQALQKIDILRTRLQAVRERSGGLSDRHFGVALTRLDAWERAARVRLQLLARQRIARLFPASAMYLRGQYSYFSGWRSLAKDLITP